METIFNQTVSDLRNIVKGFNYDVYAVGGCIRDLLLGKDPKDVDIVVDGPNGDQEFLDYLDKNYSDRISNVVRFGKFNTGTFNLRLSDGRNIDLDVAMTRIESYHSGTRKPDEVGYACVTEDAKRRDFCLNALYMNIKTGEIIDPTGRGKEDLKNRILRTPLDPSTTFAEDSLRMLRTVRFEFCKGFTLDPSVVEGIKNSCSSIETTPRERVNMELTKMMLSSNPSGAIRRLHELGLLGYVIPELEESWGWNQNSSYHHLSLTDHMLLVLDKVAAKSDKLEVRLAALLHDIAKYRNYTVRPDGHYMFVGHDKDSAKLAEVILRRLRFEATLVKKVSFLISQHMAIKSCGLPYAGKDKTTRKVARILGENLEDEMILIDADNTSHHPDHCLPGQTEQFLQKLDTLKLADHELATGNEIMAEFGLRPGKAIKMIKYLLQDMQDADPDLNQADAFLAIHKGVGVKADLKAAMLADKA